MRGVALRGVHAARRAGVEGRGRASGWVRVSSWRACRWRRRSELARGAGAGDRAPRFVHPFDDLDVIAGQGTLALELLEDVPDLARVVVPVGGGGLASGIGIALRRAGADVELVGVQARACAPYAQALLGRRGAGACAARRHDRGRDRDQAPGRADAAAAARAAGRPRDGRARSEIADAMVFLAEQREAGRGGRGRGRGGGAAHGRPGAGGGDDRGDRLGRQRRQRAAGGAAVAPRNRGGPARAHLHARARPARRPGRAARRSSRARARTW